MTSGSDSADGLTGIGAALRDARLGRALSIDECQRATRISRRYLEALEDEDFGALPAPVFARGFLRSYAQFLGVDPTMLVQRFPGEPRPAESLPAAGVLGQPPRRPRGGEYERRGGPSVLRENDALLSRQPPGYADERFADESLAPIPTIDTRTPSVRLGPWLVAAFVVLVVLAGVVAIVTLGGDDTPLPAATAPAPGVANGLSDIEPDVLPAELELTIDIMPDLSTGTVSSASVTLRRSGLPFVIVEIFDELTQPGSVLDQLPSPGTALDANSAVTLVVSLGPAPNPFAPVPTEPADATLEPPAEPVADGPIDVTPAAPAETPSVGGGTAQP
jgi:hypothetical protein